MTYHHNNKDPNLNNLHHAMQYRDDGKPEVRVNAAGITIEGPVTISNVEISNDVGNPIPISKNTTANSNTNPIFVNVNNTTLPINDNGGSITVDGTVGLASGSNYVGKVRITDGTNDLSLELPNNDGEAGQMSVPVENYNYVFNGTTWDRMRGNINEGVLVKVSNPVSTVTANQGTNPWTVNGTVAFSNTSIGVTQGTTPWNVSGSVNIDTMPEVEIKNDSGNPISISRNTTNNSSSNPIYVTSTGGSMGEFPDASVTAFEEPLAVGIMPLQQADSVYGLDPDFWNTTELRGGSVTTENSTWKVQSGTGAGGYARLATSRYATYPPGQGLLFRWTAAFTANGTTRDAFGVDNIVQNTGPVDREDGYSIGYSGATDDDEHRKIGILHRRFGKAEIRELTVTTAPTGAQTATIVIDGVTYTVSLTASTSTNFTAAQIANALKANAVASNTWDVDVCTSKITITYYSPGPRTGTYSFSSSGTGTLAVASWARLVAGSSPTDTWTYVKDWNGTVPNFDPTKLNVYAMDMRWLGAGRVRFFMEDPSTGKMVLIHTQKYASTALVPHIAKPSLRIVYRSGTTNPAITPSQNVVVTGASIFAGVQGTINQTGSSQGYYTINSSGLAKDLVHHLLSIQNPYVRAGVVNKSSLVIQDLTVSQQGQDPSIIFVIKNAVGTNTPLLFNIIPGNNPFVFAQYSDTTAQETLSLDTLANIQTLGINSSARFDLKDYNLELAPGEYLSVFISSSNAINRTSCGMTWRVD